MTRDLGAHPVALSRLLEGIGEGAILLPEFQRTFDWSLNNVRSLLATVLMSWPAGSLLLMNGQPGFALRALEGAPAKAPRVDYVVLDGQQRLTSLYHALAGVGDEVWILDATRLPEDFSKTTVDELEESLSAVEQAKWNADYPLRRQAAESLVPLNSLQSPADFFEWRDAVIDDAPSDQREVVRRKLTDLYKRLLSRVHEYSFPAVVLQADLPVEAIARIFERINRTGLRLTTFDLMVARTYDPSWNLREQWDFAKIEWPILDDFLGDGLPILQAISLTSKTRDIRQPAVLQTDPEVVQGAFLRTCQGMAAGLDWLVRECGARDASWVPYGVIPVVLGALATERNLEDLAGSLRPWFWLAVITQRYDVASSTQASSDYGQLLAGSQPVFTAVNDGRLVVSQSSLAEATKRKMGALWRGFACALALREPQDPLSGQPLAETATGLMESRTTLASLFPRGQVVAGRSPYHLRVLGNFLATTATARTLGGKPSAWSDNPTFDDDALERQFLPRSRELSALVSTPDELIANRLDRFLNFVKDAARVDIDYL